MTSEDLEDLTNDLIDILWPLLDSGVTKDVITTTVGNVLDAWEPLPDDS